jgi:hypothetical protein
MSLNIEPPWFAEHTTAFKGEGILTARARGYDRDHPLQYGPLHCLPSLTICCPTSTLQSRRRVSSGLHATTRLRYRIATLSIDELKRELEN